MHTPGYLIRTMHDGTGNSAPETAVQTSLGTRADYDALSNLHYRAGTPATVERVLVAHDPKRELRVGVLVISRPTLNGAWRSIAWPGTFDAGDKRDRARCINDQLRTISRVIVDPRYRGRGVGASLVRSYLADPLTRRTESVAAMGAISPFFERAGMRAVHPAQNRRDGTLLRSLVRLHWPVCPQACAIRLIQGERQPEPVQRTLRSWSRASASTRRLTDDRAIACAAAAALIAPPIAYAYDHD